MLAVAIGEGAVRIFPSDEAGLDLRREGVAPDRGGVAVSEVDAPRSQAAGVHGTDDAGLLRDELSQAGGPLCQGVEEGLVGAQQPA